MNFKNRDEIDTVYTSEPYYDLFEGGYIKPEDFLEPESALQVTEAIALVRQFMSEASKQGFIEET